MSNQKAAAIIREYMDAPSNMIALAADEKTSIQAIERPNGYVRHSWGLLVRGLNSTYKRHGVLNLLAALEARAGPPVVHHDQAPEEAHGVP
jgi:hypothetical protein